MRVINYLKVRRKIHGIRAETRGNVLILNIGSVYIRDNHSMIMIYIYL